MVTIGSNAFLDNQLTSITIPDSVATIGNQAFNGNRLSTVNLGSGLTDIGARVFSSNRITNVTIPVNITSIHPSAFQAQTDVTLADINNPTQDEMQAMLANIWYVRLSLEDPTNPYSLTDGAVVFDEVAMGRDMNFDGDTLDVISAGGHLIDTASIALGYLDSSNQSIAQSVTLTGQLPNGTPLTSYNVAEGPAVPAPANPFDPVPEEQQAMSEALSVYFRLGDSAAITLPGIDGYVTPEPATRTLSFDAPNSTVDYVYLTQAEIDAQNNPPVTPTDPGSPTNPVTQTPNDPVTPSSNPGTTGSNDSTDSDLADTGMNTGLIIAAAAFLVTSGVGVIAIRKFRHTK